MTKNQNKTKRNPNPTETMTTTTHPSRRSELQSRPSESASPARTPSTKVPSSCRNPSGTCRKEYPRSKPSLPNLASAQAPAAPSSGPKSWTCSSLRGGSSSKWRRN
uniref:(northern house mosquito) hypothetical protein n=1 Tax=Culex pipiens TaxID=7175 RepID=A0A8D8DHL9_CULPI